MSKVVNSHIVEVRTFPKNRSGTIKITQLAVIGSGKGSSPAFTRAMMRADRCRACSAPSTPCRPTVTRVGPPGPRACTTPRALLEVLKSV